jgi:murein DD-endopeptidase MepM/ murein hydrolase activator NlpD
MLLAGLLAILLGWSGAEAQSQRVTISARSRALQPGELVVVTAVTATPVTSLRGTAFGAPLQPFRIDPLTWRVLVGIDLGVVPGTYPIAIDVTSAAGPAKATFDLTVVAKTFRTRTLKVDDAFVNPPASVQKRIEDEAAELGRIWRESAPEKLWTDAFIRPVPHEANSAFGSRSVFNGQARNPHTGADFLSPAGTPVKAPGGGRVALARDRYYSGGTVVIDHGLGLFSFFAHLSSIDVKPGEVVTAGQVVGKVGATGRVTGAHLHWTVRAGNAQIDPLSLLAVLGPG